MAEFLIEASAEFKGGVSAAVPLSWLTYETCWETPSFPLKGSSKGNIGPYKGLYQAVFVILGGSWKLVTTYTRACNPDYNLPNWPYYVSSPDYK